MAIDPVDYRIYSFLPDIISDIFSGFSWLFQNTGPFRWWSALVLTCWGVRFWRYSVTAPGFLEHTKNAITQLLHKIYRNTTGIHSYMVYIQTIFTNIYIELTIAFLSCLKDAILQIQCIYWVAFRLAKIVFLAQLCNHFQKKQRYCDNCKWFLSNQKGWNWGMFFLLKIVSTTATAMIQSVEKNTWPTDAAD